MIKVLCLAPGPVPLMMTNAWQLAQGDEQESTAELPISSMGR